MWLVTPDERPYDKPSPMSVVTDALYGVDPTSGPSVQAKEILDALHRAGYRISVARRQWR